MEKVIAQNPFNSATQFCTSVTDEYINQVGGDGILGTVINEPPNMVFHRWRRQHGFATSTPREVVVYNDAPPAVKVVCQNVESAPVINDNCDKVKTAIEKPRGFNIRIH